MNDEEPEAAEVIAKLTPEVAESGTQHRLLKSEAAQRGVSLQPLHPGTSDPDLATYYIARGDSAGLQDVIDQLLGLEGVEGAYKKPRGEPPEGRL